MQTRPPGISNEEFQEMRSKLHEIRRSLSGDENNFRDAIEDFIHRLHLPRKIQIELINHPERDIGEQFKGFTHSIETAFNKVFFLVQEYFIDVPSRYKSFISDDYLKTTSFAFGALTYSSETLNRQKATCEICKEFRSVDIAHILPRTLIKALEKAKFTGAIPFGNHANNCFVVCPNHHRFFDRGTLTKEEFFKLDVSAKLQISKDYFEMVLQKRQETFWETKEKPPEALYAPTDGSEYRFIYDWVEKYGIDFKEILKFL